MVGNSGGEPEAAAKARREPVQFEQAAIKEEPVLRETRLTGEYFSRQHHQRTYTSMKYFAIMFAILAISCVPMDTNDPMGEPAADIMENGSSPVLAQEGPITEGTGSDWFCSGSTSHSFGPDNSIIWTFTTTNNSTRTKRQAPVTGRIYHPNGTVLTCNDGDGNSGNSCSIPTTVGSGYDSAVGEHFCCEKRSFSYVCTNVFFTADSL